MYFKPNRIFNFFRTRSGSVRILSAKVGLAFLSAASVQEKYKCKILYFIFPQFKIAFSSSCILVLYMHPVYIHTRAAFLLVPILEAVSSSSA
jgi:hypothetical protein